MSRATISNRTVTATEEHELQANYYLVAPGVWRMKDLFVNAYIIQNLEGTEWVLVDTGLKTSAKKIKELASLAFGSENSRPSAILLTHGHFDHAGSAQQLAEEWDVPVYAHRMEFPYLDGRSKYPPADPSVGGGLMSLVSFTFPRGPIDISNRLLALPEDGTIPGLSDWHWMHTPGHAPGHVSLYREHDGVLIAGDALATTRSESALAVMTQKKGLHGPPRFLTTDWSAAARSVKSLAQLQPQVIATGHGQPMYGSDVRKALNKLTREFWDIAMPDDGRYVHEPAISGEDGVMYVPPKKPDYGLMAAIGASALVVALGILYLRKKRATSV